MDHTDLYYQRCQTMSFFANVVDVCLSVLVEFVLCMYCRVDLYSGVDLCVWYPLIYHKIISLWFTHTHRELETDKNWHQQLWGFKAVLFLSQPTQCYPFLGKKCAESLCPWVYHWVENCPLGWLGINHTVRYPMPSEPVRAAVIRGSIDTQQLLQIPDHTTGAVH